MEKKLSRSFIGKVVSDKQDKTVIVLVETYKTDSKYKKRVKRSKRYAAHCESNNAKVGDVVRIVETRPLSKNKHFYVAEIVTKAVII